MGRERNGDVERRLGIVERGGARKRTPDSNLDLKIQFPLFYLLFHLIASSRHRLPSIFLTESPSTHYHNNAPFLRVSRT
jgi:hypothetical protein